MRRFFATMVSVGLASTVAFGASSLRLGSLPIQTSLLNGNSIDLLNPEFGHIAELGLAKVVSFSDAPVTFSDVEALSKPKRDQSFDPASTRGVDKELIATLLRSLTQCLKMGKNLMGGSPTQNPLVLTKSSVGPFSFRTSRLLGGFGQSFTSTPVSTTTQSLFTPDVDPENENEPPVIGQETIDVTPVPVPASLLLLGTALAGFGLMHRRQQAA